MVIGWCGCIEKEKKKIEVDCMICVLFVENNNNRHKAIEYERQVMNKKNLFLIKMIKGFIINTYALDI